MLIIDEFEFEICAKIQMDPFMLELDKDFRIGHLPAGDICIEDNDGYRVMGWERKTWKDFTGTWGSHMGRAGASDKGKADRLSSQLHDTYKTYQYPGLIIELANKDSEYGITILDERTDEHLRTLGWGLNVVQFNVIEETISYIIKMNEKIESGWKPSMTKHIATRDKSLSDIANVCSVLNIGIKEKKGEALQKKYGSLDRFIEEIRLNPDGLREIKGIGKEIVKKLRIKFAGDEE